MMKSMVICAYIKSSMVNSPEKFFDRSPCFMVGLYVVAEVRVPITLLGAEVDEYCSPEDIKHLGNILAQKPEVTSTWF